MEFKYPQTIEKSFSCFSADDSEMFYKWVTGLPEGTYATSDLLAAFKDTMVQYGVGIDVSIKAFSMALSKAGLTKSRDSKCRYHVKVSKESDTIRHNHDF